MILLILVIFLINLMFLVKDFVLNQWIIHSEFNDQKEFMPWGSDRLNLDIVKYHAGSELIFIGNDTKHTVSHNTIIHSNVGSSNLINTNHKQSHNNIQI